MRPLTILHLDPERHWGGGETQVYGLTSYLSQAGHRSVVACDPDGALCQRLRDQELPWLPLRIRSDADVFAARRLRRLVHDGNYQVVHFHTARGHALSPWLQGITAKRIVTRRMDYPVKKGPWSQLLYRRSVDRVVAISAGVRSALLSGGVPAACISVIPSGVDTARFAPVTETRARIRQAYSLGDDETVVLSVGALVERKGYHTVLHAAHHLQTQGVHLRYLICGEGPLRTALQAEAQALGLNHAVHFAGFRPDAADYYAAANLFVHVPQWEGLGVAVIEALATGLPVVASRVGGIPELIADGLTGLLVPPQDPTAVATALLQLIRDPEQARLLGQNGQTHARTRFDMTVMAKANEALYYEVLGIHP